MVQLPLKDKVAVVTGGARGIGRAIWALCSGRRQSCSYDLDLNEAQTTAEAIGNCAFSVQLDVTSQDSIEGMVKRVVEVAGAINILVNNAGFFDLGPLFEITTEIRKRYSPSMLRSPFHSPGRRGTDGPARTRWQNYQHVFPGRSPRGSIGHDLLCKQSRCDQHYPVGRTGIDQKEDQCEWDRARGRRYADVG